MVDALSPILTAIQSWLFPFTVAHGIVIAFLIGIGVWIIRIYNYKRDPTPDRIGDYYLSMPNKRQRMKVTLFGLQPEFDNETLQAVKQLAGPELAEVFEKNKQKMHFYVARHMGYEGARIESGYSIIMSEADFTDKDYYKEYNESKNWMLGISTRTREVSQATPDAEIWPAARKWGKHVVNLIYYPTTPITKEPKHTLQELEGIKATMSMVASWDQNMITLQKSKSNEITAKAADERADDAESNWRKSQSALNHARRQQLKKDYWAQQLTTIGTPLSLALIVAVIGGAAVFLPDTLAKTIPGYSPQHYIGFSVAIGTIAVWAIGKFANKG